MFGCYLSESNEVRHSRDCLGITFAREGAVGCERLTSRFTARDLAAREECAKVAETFVGGDHIARVIRAKGGAR